ncbi:DNA polymerase III subunit gamma/tau [Azonexus hydrophilus]|uniref:DNA polymerase III subunit gamma/tau n=1 Tax=Azonexus hydrophilus TaxID=418702 RepID=A0ABZ2XJV0_9RHOO
MSYQVLARKWRPRNFSTLVGQEHVVRALTHALSEQRLHHAYLFTGTRGVGKTTIARILAKSLNCETGITATPCGKCSACQEIDAGRFVDLLEVDAATNTRVDEMRQLLENAIYAPTRGRFKVYVIDEVHMLSTSAFNAMLKTLEEPPEHVKFILATTDPQKIPVTVLSRCLQFNLKQMPAPAISGHLANILQAEDIPFDQGALALIARSAGGSMRDSLSLLDQAIAHGAGRVDESQVRVMLGSVDQDHLFSILEALHEGNASALLQVASTLAVRSLSFASALQELAALLTRIQVAQCVPEAVDDEDPDRERITLLARMLSPEFVQLAYQIVNLGRAELGLAPDEHAGFLMTLLRLHAFRPRGVPEMLDTVRATPRPTAVSAAPVPKAPVAAVTPPAAAAERAAPAAKSFAEDAGDDWNATVARLALSGLAKELALNCELRALEEGRCLLRLPSTKGHLQIKPSPERLQQALSEYFGRPLVLKIELGDPSSETPAEQAGRQRQARQADAEAAIEQDMFVQEAISSLDASIVKSSIKPID